MKAPPTSVNQFRFCAIFLAHAETDTKMVCFCPRPGLCPSLCVDTDGDGDRDNYGDAQCDM